MPTPPVELEPATRETLAGIVARHKHRPGPLMPILQEVNTALNYFPEGALRYVAQETGYSVADVYRIATFYSSFSVVPRGKYVINVCMGTTCYVQGSQRLMDKVSEMLAIKEDETTPDMMFTLKGVRCIGCCGLAPALTIGTETYGKLTRQDIPDIVHKCQEVA